jgi:DNA-binding MarR family transcriptional regulator
MDEGGYMQSEERTPCASALSASALDLFKATSSMLAEGDRLVTQLGLTSSRWQVLGTIVAAPRPEPVAWLARDMGANRQNVQRIVNDLLKEGFVELANNPHHRRAALVVLTAKGQQAYDQAMRLEAPWMNRLTEGIAFKDILAMRRVLKTLRERLDSEAGDIDPV